MRENLEMFENGFRTQIRGIEMFAMKGKGHSPSTSGRSQQGSDVQIVARVHVVDLTIDIGIQAATKSIHSHPDCVENCNTPYFPPIAPSLLLPPPYTHISATDVVSVTKGFLSLFYSVR